MSLRLEGSWLTGRDPIPLCSVQVSSSARSKTPPMRCTYIRLATLLSALLSPLLAAQGHTNPSHSNAHHKLRLQFPPDQAYALLKAGADRLVLARRQYRILELRKRIRATQSANKPLAKGSKKTLKDLAKGPYQGPTHKLPTKHEGKTTPRTVHELNLKPLKRPPHAGTYIAAILTCADSRESTTELFVQNRRDLLLMSSPGPVVRPAEVAMLEQAAEGDAKLSLCVILVHQGCKTLRPSKADSRATRELAMATSPAQTLASRSGRRIEEAHALYQAQLIYRLSPKLKALHKRGEFQVAIAILEEQSGARAEGKRIRWIAPWVTAVPVSVSARPAPR